MTTDALAATALLAATFGLFLWGRWRPDMVAVTSLPAAVAAGLVPVERTSSGFTHPAVLAVAAMLAAPEG